MSKNETNFKELAGLPEYKDIEFVTINTDDCEWN
jgi:hypothetical protein